MMRIKPLKQDSLDHTEHLCHHWKMRRTARWHLAQFALQVAVALDKGRRLPWSDGTTGITLSPLALLEQLAAVVPLPVVIPVADDVLGMQVVDLCLRIIQQPTQHLSSLCSPTSPQPLFPRLSPQGTP